MYPATCYYYYNFFVRAASLCRFPICTHEQGHWFLYSEKTVALPWSALDDQRSAFCHVNQKVPGSAGQECGERSEQLWLWRQEWPPKMGVQEWNAARSQRPAALHRSQSWWNDCTLQKCWSQQPPDNHRDIQWRLLQDIQRYSWENLRTKRQLCELWGLLLTSHTVKWGYCASLLNEYSTFSAIDLFHTHFLLTYVSEGIWVSR